MRILKECNLCKCERCEHEWLPRIDVEPIICPKCKSAYWNTARDKPKVGKLETTSIKIEREVWKLARKRAVDLGLNYSEYMGQLIHNDLKNSISCTIEGCGAKAQKTYENKNVCCDCFNELSSIKS